MAREITFEAKPLKWRESETEGEADVLIYKYRYVPRIINGVLQVRLSKFTAYPYDYYGQRDKVPVSSEVCVAHTIEEAKATAQADLEKCLFQFIALKG